MHLAFPTYLNKNGQCHESTIASEQLLKTIMLLSMQMKYKWIRSVIFYSGGLSSKRGTHLSLISLVSHVMWDWSERERESLWLPATKLFAAAQCHCHSLGILMCSFLSTSINVTLGRHACKWKSIQASKRGKGETLHICFRCTWTLERQNKSDIVFLFP